MPRIHKVCFLALGIISIIVNSSYADVIWHVPETLPFDDPLEDLMMSSSEMRPFLMFASSQKSVNNQPITTAKDFTFTDKVFQPPQAVTKPPPTKKIFGMPRVSEPPKKPTPSPYKPQQLTYALHPRTLHARPRHIQAAVPRHPFSSSNRHVVKFVSLTQAQPTFQQNSPVEHVEPITHSASNHVPEKPLTHAPIARNMETTESLNSKFKAPRLNRRFYGRQRAKLDKNQNTVTIFKQSNENNHNNHHINNHQIVARPVYDMKDTRTSVQKPNFSQESHYEHERPNDNGRKFIIFRAPPEKMSTPSSSFDIDQKPTHDERSEAALSFTEQTPVLKQEHHETTSPVQTVLMHKAETPAIVIDLVTLHDVANVARNNRSPIQHSETPVAKDSHQVLASSRGTIQNNVQEPPVHQLTLLQHLQNLREFHPVTEKYPTKDDLPYLEPEFTTDSPPVTTFRPLTMASPLVVIPPPLPPRSLSTSTATKKRPVSKKKSPSPKKSKFSTSFGFLPADDTYDQNVPGRPGSDYPIYHEIPFTNFDCRDYKKPGFYADLEAGCQIFHNCDTGMKKHSFLCPNGTIFHQELFICDWWYNVSCDDSPHFYNLNAGLYAGPINDKVKADKKDKSVAH